MSTLADSSAFPLQILHDVPAEYRLGMTLRQYYAGLAMQGFLSDRATVIDFTKEAAAQAGDKSGLNLMAELAASAADALILELEKTV